MPAVAISVQVDEEVLQIQDVAERAADLRAAWAHGVQPLVTDFFTRQFDTEGAAGGTKWAPLAPVTTLLRQRPGHGRGGIGRDVGTLWASYVKSAGTTAAPGGVLDMTQTSYTRGSAVAYAGYFSEGYTSSLFPFSRRAPVPPKSGRGVRYAPRPAPVQIPGRPVVPDVLPADLVASVEAELRTYIEGF